MLDKIRVNALLDFYENLLTEKQQAICRYYYRDDLSLQEIAENERISRAAVYDMIKRSRQELQHYEDTLHLISSWQKRKALYQKIKAEGNREIGRLIDQCIDTEIEGEQDE